MTTEQKNRMIAERNDAFRNQAWDFEMTPSVITLNDVPGLIEAVRNYDDFDADAGSRQLHDVGTLLWHGSRVCWKIDNSLPGKVDDAFADMRHYCPVLTVMLASEY